MATAVTVQQNEPSAALSPDQKTVGSAQGATRQGSPFGRLLMAIGICGIVYGAVAVAHGKPYTPRSNFGFYLGVAGTLMMLALLAYPLRKHMRWMQRWGALKHWFRVHMILGLVGPTLILFHSTFHLRSPNAAVALISMLIVVASGVIGRFVYTKIHYGLYGRRATLEKVRQDFSDQSDAAKSRLHLAPHIGQWLENYTAQAMHTDRSLAAASWHLLMLKVKRPILASRCRRELRTLQRSEHRPELRRNVAEAIDLVSRYLKEVERVAHFHTYERLFSLWHVLHIPLIYLLAVSTVFHIMAAYMY